MAQHQLDHGLREVVAPLAHDLDREIGREIQQVSSSLMRASPVA
jgi:hypothetical protein